ncbi:hypothetical protein DFJ74DRAFT_274578 [Hyaloraphidium curvatum]|nr:hypothetical protein DFJ74DRAFT_274578 [Hyaloraphidium curvatum]
MADVAPREPAEKTTTLVDLPNEVIELVLSELAPKDVNSCLTVHSSLFAVGWRILWQHLDLTGRTVKKLRLVESVLRAAAEAAAAEEKRLANELLPSSPECSTGTFAAPSLSLPAFPSFGTSSPAGKRGRWNGIVKKKRAWHAEAAQQAPRDSFRSSASSRGDSSSRRRLGAGQPYLPSAVRKITYRNGDFADLAPLLILCGPYLVALDVRGCRFKSTVALSIFDLVNANLKELDMSIDYTGPSAGPHDVESLLDPGHEEVGAAVARFRGLEKLGVANRNMKRVEVDAILALPELQQLELAEDRAWNLDESVRPACAMPTLRRLKFSSWDYEAHVPLPFGLEKLEFCTHVANRSVPANDMANGVLSNRADLGNLRALKLHGPVGRTAELFLCLAALPNLDSFELDYQAATYPPHVMNDLVAGIGHLAAKGRPDSDVRPLKHLALLLNLNDKRHSTIIQSLGGSGPIALRSLRLDPRRAKIAKATVDALCALPCGTFADLEDLTLASRKMRVDSVSRLLSCLPNLRRLRWTAVHPVVLPRARTRLRAIEEDLRRAGGGWEIDMNPLRITLEVRGRMGLEAMTDGHQSAVGEAEEEAAEEEDEEAPLA